MESFGMYRIIQFRCQVRVFATSIDPRHLRVVLLFDIDERTKKIPISFSSTCGISKPVRFDIWFFGIVHTSQGVYQTRFSFDHHKFSFHGSVVESVVLKLESALPPRPFHKTSSSGSVLPDLHQGCGTPFLQPHLQEG